MILKPVLFAILILGLLGAAQETYAAVTVPGTTPSPPSAELAIPYTLSNTIFVQDKDSCLKLPNTTWDDPTCTLNSSASFTVATISKQYVRIESGIEFRIADGATLKNYIGIKNLGTFTNDGSMENYETILNHGTMNNNGLLQNWGMIENPSIIQNYGYLTNHGPDGIIKGEQYLDSVPNSNDKVFKQKGFLGNTNEILNSGKIQNLKYIGNTGIIDTRNAIEVIETFSNDDTGIVYNYASFVINGYDGNIWNAGTINNCVGFTNYFTWEYIDAGGTVNTNYDCVSSPLSSPSPSPSPPPSYQARDADSGETREKIEQRVETRTSDEFRERTEQALTVLRESASEIIVDENVSPGIFVDDNEMTSELMTVINRQSLEILQLQAENNEFKSLVSGLEKKIQGLNGVIMEQIRVMLEVLGIG